MTTAPLIQFPGPQNITCCEPWLSGWLLYGHREGGRGRRGLCAGQRPVASEGDGHASCLQRRLVVSQLVNALLLQQEGLLWGEEAATECLHGALTEGLLRVFKVCKLGPISLITSSMSCRVSLFILTKETRPTCGCINQRKNFAQARLAMAPIPQGSAVMKTVPLNKELETKALSCSQGRSRGAREPAPQCRGDGSEQLDANDCTEQPICT